MNTPMLLTNHSFAYRGFVFAELPDGWYFQRVLTRQVWGPFAARRAAEQEADRVVAAWEQEAKREELRNELVNEPDSD